MAHGPERKIQDKAVKHARSVGCFAVKFESNTAVGVPDFLFSHANCGVFFIEFKAPGQKPKPHQVSRMAEMGAAGCRCFWTDSSRKAIEIIDKMVAGETP